MDRWVDQEYADRSFDGHDLSDSEIVRCSLTRCRFAGTRLSEAQVRDCQFEECDFTGARLNAAAFTNVSEPTSHFILSSTFGSAINGSAFYDDAYKELITATATETDPAKRKQGYAKINDYLLDAAYCLVISGYPNILVQAGNVRDLKYYPVLQWTLRTTWLA